MTNPWLSCDLVPKWKVVFGGLECLMNFCEVQSLIKVNTASQNTTCMIFLFLQCVSTVIIGYIIISPLNSYLYIHWILDFK